MATVEQTLSTSWSNDAGFAAVVQDVHQAMLDTGAVEQTTDTGQFDFGSPPSRTSGGKLLYKFIDADPSLADVILRVDHWVSGGDSRHYIAPSIGTATDGAGSFSGYSSYTGTPTLGQVNSPITRTVWAAGGNGWIWLLIGNPVSQQITGFTLERSTPQDGVPTDDFALLQYANSPSPSDRARALLPIASPAAVITQARNAQTWAHGRASDTVFGKWSSGSSFLTVPLFIPWHPHWMTSAVMRASVSGAASYGDSFSIEHMGAARTFRAFTGTEGVWNWSLDEAGAPALLRWE